MSFVFSLCDRDGNGALELYELSDLLSDAADDMRELGQHVKARLPLLAFNGDPQSMVEGDVSLDDFEEMLKSDEHMHLNFFWTWLPYINGPLLHGLEALEACLVARGFTLDQELALKLCPIFARKAKDGPDGRITARHFADAMFDFLGAERLEDDAFAAAAASSARSPKEATTPVRPPETTTGFFSTPAGPASDEFRNDLARACATIHGEVLRRVSAREKALDADVAPKDQFGAEIARAGAARRRSPNEFPRHGRGSLQRTIRAAAAASPRLGTTEYPRRGDLVPRNIRVAAAASPRLGTTEYPRRGRGVAATWYHGISASRPRCRRDSSPRNAHVAAATRLHGMSTWRPRRRRDTEYPRRGRGVAATRLHGMSTSQPRRRRDSPADYPRRSRGVAEEISARPVGYRTGVAPAVRLWASVAHFCCARGQAVTGPASPTAGPMVAIPREARLPSGIEAVAAVFE